MGSYASTDARGLIRSIASISFRSKRAVATSQFPGPPRKVKQMSPLCFF